MKEDFLCGHVGHKYANAKWTVLFQVVVKDRAFPFKMFLTSFCVGKSEFSKPVCELCLRCEEGVSKNLNRKLT